MSSELRLTSRPPAKKRRAAGPIAATSGVLGAFLVGHGTGRMTEQEANPLRVEYIRVHVDGDGDEHDHDPRIKGCCDLARTSSAKRVTGG